MAGIMSVLGELSGDQLGVVDYHEHLSFNAPSWLLREDRDFALNDPDKSAAELATWVTAGGKTIIEMSALDFGRDIHAYRHIAAAVPEAQIIAITGFNKPYFCDAAIFSTADDILIKQCIRDIEVGIDGTDSKAGLVKGGSGYNTMNEYDQKLLRVAAKVHLETGVPLITHTEAGTMGYEQLEVLEGYGVEPQRVCLSHMDRNPDFWEHKRIAQLGAYLGYDCPGKTKYGPDELRIDVLKRLIDVGLGTKILLGNDLGRPSYWRHYGGGPGLDFVLKKHVPRLQDEGISAAAIDDLLVHNPRRYLCGE